MTLDEARDAFRADPTPRTAAACMREAHRYLEDNILSVESYMALVQEIADTLTAKGR